MTKAILIDPWAKSLETIDLSESPVASLEQLYKLVGEDGLDFAYVMPGEGIAVGDHSALAKPPLPSYTLHGYHGRLYGRGVLFGYDSAGAERQALRYAILAGGFDSISKKDATGIRVWKIKRRDD